MNLIRIVAIIVSFMFIPAVAWGSTFFWALLCALVMAFKWRTHMVDLKFERKHYSAPRTTAVLIRKKLAVNVFECVGLIFIPQAVVLTLLRNNYISPDISFLDQLLYDLVLPLIYVDNPNLNLTNDLFDIALVPIVLFSAFLFVGLVALSFRSTWQIVNYTFWRKPPAFEKLQSRDMSKKHNIHIALYEFITTFFLVLSVMGSLGVLIGLTILLAKPNNSFTMTEFSILITSALWPFISIIFIAAFRSANFRLDSDAYPYK